MNYRTLIEAGVHFGHQKTRWCPLMKPYIWGLKSGIHLIDVSKTLQALEEAGKFLEQIAAEGKQVLFVGTKPAAQKIIEEAAIRAKAPFISYRWVGGLLTNHSQVKKSLVKMLNYEEVLEKAEDFRYTKKELNSYKKIAEKLNKSLKGIRELSWPVGAVVLVDAKKENTALKEAIQSEVPVVALVDTNTDPSGVDFVIPGNDDSPKSISLIVDYLATFVERGKAASVAKAKKAKEDAEAKKAAAKKEVKASDEHKIAAKSVVKTEVKVAEVPKKEVAKTVTKVEEKAEKVEAAVEKA